MPEVYTPSGFAESILGLSLYPWQTQILSELMPVNAKVTLRAANESGKTSIIAASFVVWHLALFPGSQVVCTSGVWRQVTEQLWRPLKNYANQLGWRSTQDTIETPQGAKAIGFSTTEGGKFEGFHAEDHYKIPLGLVVDEAKTVSDEVFIGMERCHPTRWLIQSSTGAPHGGFFEYCQDPRFKHFKVTAWDCPHLGKERVKEVADKYGETSMKYKSIIDAEWMSDPCQTFICSRRAIDKCFASRVNRKPGRPIAGIDIAHAESGNENVLAVRYGNVIELDCHFAGSGDAIAIVDRLIARLNLRRLTPSDVWIDGDGIGAVYQNIFSDKGWPINIWRGQERAFDSATYFNRSAESWMNLARSIEKCEVIIPADEDFIEQFTSREYYINPKGQIQLRPKEDARSPDRADAVTICWSIPSAGAIQFADPVTENEPSHLFEWSLNHSEQNPWKNYQRILPKGFNVGI